MERPNLAAWKEIVRVHGIPAGRLVPQLFVSMKPALAVMLAMFRAAPPVLVRVTVCDVLVPPTRAINFRSSGTSFTCPTVIVTTEVADLVVSSTETAFSDTVGLAGTAAGAV